MLYISNLLKYSLVRLYIYFYLYTEAAPLPSNQHVSFQVAPVGSDRGVPSPLGSSAGSPSESDVRSPSVASWHGEAKANAEGTKGPRKREGVIVEGTVKREGG